MNKPRPKLPRPKTDPQPLPAPTVLVTAPAEPAAEKCASCQAELVSGAFGQRACRTCNPSRFDPCLKCGATRLACCC